MKLEDLKKVITMTKKYITLLEKEQKIFATKLKLDDDHEKVLTKIERKYLITCKYHLDDLIGIMDRELMDLYNIQKLLEKGEPY
jgi:hypothetical protein